MLSSKKIADWIYVFGQLLSPEFRPLLEKQPLLKVLLPNLEKSYQLLLQSSELDRNSLTEALQEIVKRLMEEDHNHDLYRRVLYHQLKTLEVYNHERGEEKQAKRYEQGRKSLFPSGLRINLQSYEHQSAMATQFETVLKSNEELRNLLGSISISNETALHWGYKIVEAGQALQRLLKQRTEQEEKLGQVLKAFRNSSSDVRSAMQISRQTLKALETNLNLLALTDPALEEIKRQILQPVIARQEAVQNSKNQTDKPQTSSETPS